MNLIFFNNFGRLRSGWRFAVYFGLLFFITILFTLIIGLAFSKESLDAFFANRLNFPIQGLFLAVTAIFVGWLCGKVFEDLPFRTLGASFTENWLKDFLLGSMIGAFTLFFAAFIGFFLGGFTFALNQAVNFPVILQNLAFTLVIFLLGAAGEEAMFRGYPFQTLARSNLAWLAIALTAVFFAQAHAFNPNVSTFGLINTALAGIWLGLAYLKTRNLWFPLGLHWAWNWALASVLGLPVSGITDISPSPLFVGVDTGPTWLTGGHYGIEGGLICTMAIALSTILIWFAPFLRANEELLALTNKENPVPSVVLSKPLPSIFEDADKEGSENDINQ